MPGRISILFTRFGLFVVMRSRMLFSRVAVWLVESMSDQRAYLVVGCELPEFYSGS